MNSIFEILRKFADGEFELRTKRKPVPPRKESHHKEETIHERYKIWHDKKATQVFDGIYKTASVIICLLVIGVLLVTTSYLPKHGDASNPINNEVSERYVEQGMAETGAVNTVTGMILDYRAFDTFGESAVLFMASACVLVLMKTDEKNKDRTTVANPNYKPLERNPIVKNIAKYVIPFLLIFGVYIVLNGHISPGGGFAGGAVMGASLILYSSAYGYRTIRKVITERFVRRVTFCSLSFYACAKGYSFFMGANHFNTGIPLGIPGDIFSSGLILYLNICVGLIVTCTMYSFYSLFTKGEV